MKKDIRLYNVMFPLWMLLIFPMTWLIVAPLNFLIDSAVLLIAMRLLHVQERKAVYKKAIIKVWLLGFAADLIGGAFLYLVLLIPYEPQGFLLWWYENMTNAVALNPFENLFSFLYVALVVALSGVCIYLFNRFLSFRKLGLEAVLQKRLALSLAVFTAPYVLLFPSELLYKSF